MQALRRHLARRARPLPARTRLLKALLHARPGGASPADRARRTLRLAPLARVLRRTAWVVNGGSSSLHWTLQALPGLGRHAPAPRAEPRTAVVRSRLLERVAARERWVLVQRATQLQRVERRTELRTATASVRTVIAHPAVRLPAFAPLPLTMARSAPPPARPADARAVAQAAVPPAVGDAPPARRPRATMTAPEVSLPPQELSRVTEHVIRQLDRRVLSFQERSGRI
jgi:hypothetical protein